MIFDKLYKTYMDMYVLVEHILDTIPRKFLGLKTSIIDLPDTAPYGFWVDRSGNFLQVRRFGHDEGIDHIADSMVRYAKLKGLDTTTLDYPTGYNSMFTLGWCRVVISYKHVMYEIGKGTLTTSQQKFLNILRDMYELEDVVRDA